MKVLSFLFFFTSLSSYNLKDFTLEQKVGQVFMAYFDGEDLNEYGRELIEKTHLGSYIYYYKANGEKDHNQMKKFTTSLQDCAKTRRLPFLFICCDQEGGIVSSLKKGFVPFPGNAALGKTNDPHLAYLTGLYQAYELRSCGINLNLAPVVDVNNNPCNPVIGIRSFSNEPDKVISYATEMITGYNKGSLYCCLKHFPGHGDVIIDSHKGLPVVDKSLEELKKTELLPFYSLSKQAPFIMTAHILFPQIDPENPATLSKVILQDILRKDMGYNGVIIADSLTMKGVLSDDKKIEDVAIEAFLAGCDILCIGGDFETSRPTPEAQVKRVIRIYDKFLDAVRNKQIPEKRLNESVARILKLKEEKKYFSTIVPEYNKDDALFVAKQTAEKATVIVKPAPDVLYNKKILFLVPKHLIKDFDNRGHDIEEDILNKIGKENHTYYYDPLEASFDTRVLEDIDLVVFFSYNSWKFEKQKNLIEQISLKKPTYCIALTESELNKLNNPQMKMAIHSPSLYSLKYVAQYLQNVTLDDTLKE